MARPPTVPLSQVDPRGQALDRPGGPDALLLLHGFTGTPAEMRPLADKVNSELGWRTLAPLLPGHGTTLRDLNKTGSDDWLAAARKAFDLLCSKHANVHIAGLSMGSLLALELARERPRAVRSLALLVPPIRLRRLFQRFGTRLFMKFPKLAQWAPNIPKGVGLAPGQVAYTSYPPRALGEFGKLVIHSRSLPVITDLPAFICVTPKDEVVNISSADFLRDRFPHPATRILRLKTSIHVVTCGNEFQSVLREAVAFYRAVTSPSSVPQGQVSQSI